MTLCPMKYPRLLAIASAVALIAAFAACSDPDDPDAMTIPVNAINATSDGTSHHLGSATWSQASSSRLMGASPLAFSVSDEAKVYFSPGNLQYNSTNGRWQFSRRQYLTVATDPDAADGLIDLFGWGTSGWESGAVAIEPQAVDAADSNYWVAGDSLAGLVGDYAEADWAYHNAIVGGGNRARQWRVLQAAEWQYLLGENPTRRGRWGMATLEGSYRGLVVLPDQWAAPAGISFVAGASGWETNRYSLVDWFRMEQSGAVFMPAAGYREGAVSTSIGQTGNYWASDAASGICAHDLFFRAQALDATDIDARHYGFAVRPVLQ